MLSWQRKPSPKFQVIKHGRPRPFDLSHLDSALLGEGWLAMERMNLHGDWDIPEELLLALVYGLATKPLDRETLALFGMNY